MRTVLFSALLFFALSASSQNQIKKEKNGQNMLAKTDGTVTAPPTATSTPVTDGPNLSPEQQGYTKQIIDGKDVYVKQVGQMTFYYEPKK